MSIWLGRIQRVKTLLAAIAGFWFLSCVAPLIAVWIPLYHWGNLPATTMILPDDASIWADIIRYNPLLRLPEFCAGMLLAKLFQRCPPEWHKRGPWLYLPAGLLIVLVLQWADQIPYPLLHNGLLLPLFAALILGLALGGGWPCQWLSASVLTFLGNASYAMYILHAPIYTWLGLVFRYAFHLQPAGWLWFVAYVCSVIAVASVFFKWMEEPAHRALRSKLNHWIKSVG